jgi:drug/metabolite transporter (DMT)-like permease
MLFLTGSLAGSAIFAQSYKYAVARGRDVDWVSLTSFAFGVLFLALGLSGSISFVSLLAVGLGVAYGLTGGSAQLTFFRAVRYGDMSVSWTIVQLSTLIPVLASIFVWREQPNPVQALAVGAMVAAILLMGNVELKLVAHPLHWAGWLGLSFLLSGLSSLCLKVLRSSPSASAEATFLLIAYLVSVVLTVPLVRGRGPSRWDLAIGVVRGMANLAANYCLLQALEHLPGYLVFSVYSASGVMLNVLLAVLLWHERPDKWAWLGVVVAVLSIVALSLGS